MSANAIGAVGGLRDRRAAAGLSQQELAHRARCSVAMVRLLERGYEPEGSRVRSRVLTVLRNDERPAVGPGAVQESAGTGGREAA